MSKPTTLVVRDAVEQKIMRAALVQLIKTDKLPMVEQMRSITLYNKLNTLIEKK